MEIEYKWEFPEGGLGRLAEVDLFSDMLGAAEELHMHAVYYDSVDGLVKDAFGGLRVRRENGAGVCCLKLPAPGSDGVKARREFEVAADDIREGLRLLPGAGAPQELCDALLASELTALCETEFSRRALRFMLPQFVAELAVDEGEMRREGRKTPIRELELELLEGDEQAFHEFAARLEAQLGLEQQPLSKLARAMNL